MTDKKRPVNPDETATPPGFEEDPDWFVEVGPEDEDPDTIAQNLDDYGFNQTDEDDFESDPVGPSDSPDWTENAVYGEDRPLIPDDEERKVPANLDLDDVHLIEDEDKRR